MHDNMDDTSLNLEVSKIKHYSDDLDMMFVKTEEIPNDLEIEELMRPIDDIKTKFSKKYIESRSRIIIIHEVALATDATKKAQIELKKLVEEANMDSHTKNEYMKQIVEFPSEINKNRNIDYYVLGYDSYDEIPEEIIKKVA